EEHRPPVQHRPQLRRTGRDRRRRAEDDRGGCSSRRDRRTAHRRVSLYRGPAGSRPAHSHERRDAHQQLPALADRLLRNLGHRHALARLPRSTPAAGHPGIPETRSPLRRAHPVARGNNDVTRVLSGLVLASTVLAIAWLAPPEGLLALAIVVATLAFLALPALCRSLWAPLPTAPAPIAPPAGTITAAWP